MSNNEVYNFLTIRVFKTFVNGDSMTNAKLYQGFHDDEKVEEYCPYSFTIVL